MPPSPSPTQHELRPTRFLRGLRQRDVAKAADVSPGLLSLIERGLHRASPEVERRIRRALATLEPPRPKQFATGPRVAVGRRR